MLIRADLHIHTVLSPCGDLEMSPANILQTAVKKGLQLIGITDHNSTRQAELIREYSKKYPVFVLAGAEVTTKEEVHCLTFFPGREQLTAFQAYLDIHLPSIPNNPEKIGDQVVANLQDQIIYEEKKLLLSALDQSIEEIETKVRQLDGIFIPAHINKPRFSILSQLGFIPPALHYDALELSPYSSVKDFIRMHPELRNASFIQSSDAHYLSDIGKVSTFLNMETFSFQNIREAIRKSIF